MSDTTALYPSKHYRDALYAQLKLLPIDGVCIEFQGGGDSGEIYNIYAKAKHEGNEVDLKQVGILWLDLNNKEVMMPLDKILEDVGYRALDMSDLDWYNNDGGQGSIEIVLDDGEPYVNMHMEINYVSHEDHEFDSREGDLTEYAGDDDDTA